MTEHVARQFDRSLESDSASRLSTSRSCSDLSATGTSKIPVAVYSKLHPTIFSQLPNGTKLEYVTAYNFGGLIPAIFASLPEPTQQDVAVALHSYIHHSWTQQPDKTDGGYERYTPEPIEQAAEVGNLLTSGLQAANESETDRLPMPVSSSLGKHDAIPEQEGHSPTCSPSASEKAYRLWKENALVKGPEWSEQLISSEWLHAKPSKHHLAMSYSMTNYEREPAREPGIYRPDRSVLTGSTLQKLKELKKAQPSRSRYSIAEIIEGYLDKQEISGSEEEDPGFNLDDVSLPETPPSSSAEADSVNSALALPHAYHSQVQGDTKQEAAEHVEGDQVSFTMQSHECENTNKPTAKWSCLACKALLKHTSDEIG